jgi:uncharacterized membrane protein YeaQ/YmgE (transglycosylase-associated protein family)
MNIAIWILAGGAAGWMAYTLLHANAGRGALASIIIGAAGGFFGGKVLAPVFGALEVVSNEFDLLSTVVAVASAAGLLAIGHLLSSRYNV